MSRMSTAIGSEPRIHEPRIRSPRHFARLPMKRMTTIATTMRTMMLALGCAMTAGVAGCSGDSPVALAAEDRNTLWAVRYEVGAATVALGGTQQLTAVPLRVDGSVAATGVSAVQYVSLDTSKVTVTPDGVVRGVAVTTSGVAVVASATSAAGVTVADTALVGVMATARSFKSLSVLPLFGDTAKVEIGQYGAVNVVAMDSNDVRIFGMTVRYKLAGPAFVKLYGASPYGLALGTTKLVVETIGFGVARSDTLDLVVTNPMFAAVYCYGNSYPGVPPFYNVETFVGAGGTVNFINYGFAPTAVTFDNPADVPDGNFELPNYGDAASRTFPAVGTYKFKDHLGNPGVIYVVPN